MATRAQRFKLQEEIKQSASKPKTAPAQRRKRADDKEAPNRYDDTGNHATSAMETTETGRPTRKSTRRAANRIKPDSQLRRRQTRRTRSPKARATKAAARKSSK